MIALVQGTVATSDGDHVVVMTASGVGYELAVPLSVLEHLPAVGHQVMLHAVTVIREDSSALYGFGSGFDRRVFQRLLNASGVGPRLALALLSALGATRVVRAVRDKDLAALCTVPGVGKKKAERMVLELADRMREFGMPDQPEGPGPAPEQAIAALTNLGYGYLDADAAVRAAAAAADAGDVPGLIRGALQHLSKGK